METKTLRIKVIFRYMYSSAVLLIEELIVLRGVATPCEAVCVRTSIPSDSSVELAFILPFRSARGGISVLSIESSFYDECVLVLTYMCRPSPNSVTNVDSRVYRPKTGVQTIIHRP